MDRPGRAGRTGGEVDIFARYNSILTFVTTLLVFSGLPGFLYQTERTGIPPSVIWIGLFALSLPLVLTFNPFILIRHKYILWFTLLVIMAAISTGGDIFDLSGSPRALRLFSAALLCVMFAIQLHDNVKQLHVSRWAIYIGTLAAVAFNWVDVIFPRYLVPDRFNFVITGRSAGLYFNSNEAPFFIIVGMIISLSFIRPERRGYFVALCTSGALLSLSRSGTVNLAIVLIALVWLGILKARYIAWVFVTVVLLAMSSAFFFQYLSASNAGLNENYISQRFDWFSETKSVQDNSAQARLYIAEKGLEVAMKNPLIGAGYGYTSTSEWGEEISVHNMYVLYAAEMGIIGCFLYPLLLMAIFTFKFKDSKPYALLVAGSCVFQGFFMHTIPTDYTMVCAFSWFYYALHHPQLFATSSPTQIPVRIPGPPQGPVFPALARRPV